MWLAKQHKPSFRDRDTQEQVPSAIPVTCVLDLVFGLLEAKTLFLPECADWRR